jgi:uracil-DNA glycosylase family 4
VPGFGDPAARLVIVGLAPGAHGANRTGRLFTGDQSGHFLYAALHRAGYANQPTSVSREDGLTLTDCYITAAGRCAPPDNKPTPQELKNCSVFLDAEFGLLERMRVILALGSIAWEQTVGALIRQGRLGDSSGVRCRFAHGAELQITPRLTLLGSYHVSQQNTFTGRLTPGMFDAMLKRCRAVVDFA